MEQPKLNMHTRVIKEAGYEEALLGLSLSFNADLERMPKRAEKLAPLDKGHNKCLESIAVWLDVRAPRYWWQEYDTYRVGVTKQSESTMHTLMKRELTQDDFVEPIAGGVLSVLNSLIRRGLFRRAKVHLPEAFLQRRIVMTNYKGLRHLIMQRHDHKLPEWQLFIHSIVDDLEHPELLGVGDLVKEVVDV